MLCAASLAFLVRPFLRASPILTEAQKGKLQRVQKNFKLFCTGGEKGMDRGAKTRYNRRALRKANLDLWQAG